MVSELDIQWDYISGHQFNPDQAIVETKKKSLTAADQGFPIAFSVVLAVVDPAGSLAQHYLWNELLPTSNLRVRLVEIAVSSRMSGQHQ